MIWTIESDKWVLGLVNEQLVKKNTNWHSTYFHFLSQPSHVCLLADDESFSLSRITNIGDLQINNYEIYTVTVVTRWVRRIMNLCIHDERICYLFIRETWGDLFIPIGSDCSSAWIVSDWLISFVFHGYSSTTKYRTKVICFR